MAKSKYSPSLFGSIDGVDFLTGIECDTARHEIFNGAYRDYSKEDGLWIAVSPANHEMIHESKEDGSVWDELRKQAEVLWLTADWSRTVLAFVKRYGANYL